MAGTRAAIRYAKAVLSLATNNQKAEAVQADRWIIGGDPAGVARAQGDLLNYAEWQELCKLSLEYPTLRKLLDTLVTTYYTVKEHK